MIPRGSSYQRLPGRGFSLVHWDTIWRGDDHVLAVQAAPRGDAYRRFFYRDIEAIIMRRTHGRLWINLALFALTGVALYPLLYMWAVMPFERMMAVTAAGAAVPLILAVINTVLGPTCEVRIQTAVQSERVAALSRVRSARATIALLRPLIWQVQQAESAAASTAASKVPGSTPVPPP